MTCGDLADGAQPHHATTQARCSPSLLPPIILRTPRPLFPPTLLSSSLNELVFRPPPLMCRTSFVASQASACLFPCFTWTGMAMRLPSRPSSWKKTMAPTSPPLCTPTSTIFWPYVDDRALVISLAADGTSALFLAAGQTNTVTVTLFLTP